MACVRCTSQDICCAAHLLADAATCWTALERAAKLTPTARGRILDAVLRGSRDVLKAASALVRALVAPKGKQQGQPGAEVLAATAAVSHQLVAKAFEAMAPAQGEGRDGGKEQQDPNAAVTSAMQSLLVCCSCACALFLLVASQCLCAGSPLPRKRLHRAAFIASTALRRFALHCPAAISWKTSCFHCHQVASWHAGKKEQTKKAQELARAKKDASLIPDLVFWIESYEIACLKLSKAANCPIVKGMKRATSRDIKFKVAKA